MNRHKHPQSTHFILLAVPCKADAKSLALNLEQLMLVSPKILNLAMNIFSRKYLIIEA